MNQKDFLNIILIAIIVAIVGVLLVSAVVFAQIDNNIPRSILEKTDQIIISRVGTDFFNKFNFKYDPNKSEYHPAGSDREVDHYMVIYSFRIPEIYKNYSVSIEVDMKSGNPFPEYYGAYLELPDCVNDPKECVFPIDGAEALKIAKNTGLKEGLSGLNANFFWQYKYKTYVWEVKNTLSSTLSGISGEAYGESILIDANSGEILEKSEWRAIASKKPTQDKTNFIIYILIAIVILFISVFIIRKFLKKR